MNETNSSEDESTKIDMASSGPVQRVVMRFRCHLFGCEPHPDDYAPPEYAECRYCGEIVSYEHMVGLTKWNALKDWFKYWFFKRWLPSKCIDCGKRFGNHDGCIPF